MPYPRTPTPWSGAAPPPHSAPSTRFIPPRLRPRRLPRLRPADARRPRHPLRHAGPPGEDANAPILRAELGLAQAKFGDGPAITRARAVFAFGKASPATQRAALDVVGATAGNSGPLLLAVGLNNPDTVWTAVASHLQKHDWPMDPTMRWRIIPALTAAAGNPIRATDIQTWGPQELPESARCRIDSAIQSIHLNRSTVTTALPDLTHCVSQH
jgi:hypothetical protein